MSETRTERSFGNTIENNMTGPHVVSDSNIKNTSASGSAPNSPMEKNVRDKKEIIGSPKSMNLASGLGKEILNIVHQSTSSLDDLVEDIEDATDDIYFVDEVVLYHGKEHVIKDEEKRGGLVQYNMVDGAKINKRDLKRPIKINEDFIKKIIDEMAKFDGKKWTVNEDARKKYKVKETLAPIFMTTPKSSKKSEEKKENMKGSDTSSDEEEEKEDGDDEPRVTFQGRASGGVAPTANRKSLQAQQQKADEKKKIKEAKKLEKEKLAEEKKKVKEEKKAKKEEKEGKGRKSNGGLEKFLKKTGENKTPSNGSASPFMSPAKRAKKAVDAATKQLSAAWQKRDLEMFNEACVQAKKNLSRDHTASLENELWVNAINKLRDKAKDKDVCKTLKKEQKEKYRAEMAEKRKEQYGAVDAKIKAYFNLAHVADDLTLVPGKLEIKATKIDVNEEMIRCMTITQFLVSVRKFAHYSERITAAELHAAVNNGVAGFRECTWKVFEAFLQAILRDDAHKKVAHMNARVAEFVMDENSISEICRAFLIGKTKLSDKRRRTAIILDDGEKKEKEESVEKEKDEGEEPAEENENEEDGDDDEEDSEMNLSQVEVEGRQRILGLFPADKLLWELPTGSQLEVLDFLLHTTIELDAFREYISDDMPSNDIQIVKHKLAQYKEQLVDLKQELSDMPSYEDVNAELLSRTQSRKMVDDEKKKERLEKKIEDVKEISDQLQIKIAREQDVKSRTKRLHPIGQDRHFRNYYWMAYTPDAGIWVQDLGTTDYEKFVEKCIEQKIDDIDFADPDTLPDYEEAGSYSTETWYKLTEEEELTTLRDSLLKNGRREGTLKKYLEHNMADILASIKTGLKSKKKNEGSRSRSQSVCSMNVTDAEDMDATDADEREENGEKMEGDENVVDGPMTSIRKSIMTMLRDLKESGLTRIDDADVFETRLDDAETLAATKPLLIEFFDAILPTAIILKLPMAIAKQKGHFSHLQSPRFRDQLSRVTNVSAVHMLLSYLDARIDWGKSVQERRCAQCKSKRSSESKLICARCDECWHLHCVKPSLREMPLASDKWQCSNCERDEEKERHEAMKNMKYDDIETGSEANTDDESDNNEEEKNGEENEEETDAPRRPPKRKAAQDDDEEKPKKKKDHHLTDELRQVFELVRTANVRLFRVLQSVPIPKKKTRGAVRKAKSIDEIEDSLIQYTSVDELQEDLSAFLKIARDYIETHNERKLEEFDEMMSQLDF